MADVTLRVITKETLRSVIGLKVRDDQQGLVAPNAVSVAEAHFEEQAWFRAIYADDEAVGFIMLAHDAEEGVDFLWRMMIAEEAQGRGYGRQAMEVLIESTRRDRPQIEALVLSHLPFEGNAGPFYERMGFTYTGGKTGIEPLMRLGIAE